MKKETKRHIYIAVAVTVAVSIVIEALFAHPHGNMIWHRVPGADAVIAIVGGFFLIFAAKKVLGPLVQRDEDYYDKKRNGGE